MSPQPVDSSAPAPQVVVHVGDGSSTPGYVVRKDTVLLVAPPLLRLPLRVEFDDGTMHDVVAVHVTEQPGMTDAAVCALLLPADTVVVDGNLFPPADRMPALTIPPGHGTRSLWCRMFPRIPGCS